MTATQSPDATWLTNVYTPAGQIQQTYGSRTYPVGYGDDAEGRMTKMTNWTASASGTGARVTTWNFDQYRGWLTGKTYDGGAAGPRFRRGARYWCRDRLQDSTSQSKQRPMKWRRHGLWPLIIVLLTSSLRADDEFAAGRGRAGLNYWSHNRARIVHNDEAAQGNDLVGFKVSDASSCKWPVMGKRFTNIVYLDLETGAENIPDEVLSALASFPQLRYLQIKAPKMREIGPNISILTNLHRLRSLEWEADRGTNIDTAIYQLDEIRDLYIVMRELRLPDGIRRLQKLVNLDLGEMKRIPMSVNSLPSDLKLSSIQGFSIARALAMGDPFDGRTRSCPTFFPAPQDSAAVQVDSPGRGWIYFFSR